MAETVNCSIIGQKGKGGSSYSTAATYMGTRSSTNFDDYVMSFTTGDFIGKCKSITFSIHCANTSTSGTKTYRYALLSSDANAKGSSKTTNLYYNHCNAVTEDNQIITGTVDWANIGQYSQKTLTIEVESLKPNTEYYLVLWASSTTYSMITMSTVSSHGGITLEFDPSFTVIVDHKLQNEDGSSTQFEQATYTIDAGTLYTPELRSPPSTNTTEGATFKAWKTDWSLIAEGVVGVDYVTVNEDLFVSVYYPVAVETGSYILYNLNGQIIECELFRITDGEPILQELFHKTNGEIIEI